MLFIYNKKKRKFLLILNVENKEHPEYTKNLVINQTKQPKIFDENFIVKKIKNKFEINLIDVIPLNWGKIYTKNGEEIKEMSYFVITNSDLHPKTNEVKYAWLNLDDFIQEINWEENKDLLKKVLTKAIKKEIYFNKEERGQ